MLVNQVQKNPFVHLIQKLKFTKSRTKLSDNLNDLAVKLEMLNADSEGDFLSIGSNLQDFSRRAREISETSATLAGLMTGEEINHTIDKLSRIFAKLGDLGGECQCRLDALQQIIVILSGVEQSVTGFMQIVRTLLMLGVFTRVESSHIGANGADFYALANQVNELARDIEAKSNKILGQSQSLAVLMQHSLKNASSIKELQQDQIQRMVQNTTLSLNSLKEKHRRSSSVAAHVADKYKEIYSNIDHIVTLLQFHDITKQQIEHVKDAIFNLANNIGETPVNGDKEDKLNVSN
jgi:rRNA-processing protein FCF1